MRSDYQYYWLKEQSLPPLITLGSATDRSPAALGQPGTVILYGNQNLDDQARHGGRFTGGFWFDSEHSVGMEATYSFLGQRNTSFAAAFAGGADSLVLGRPFYDVGFDPNNPASPPGLKAEIVSFPGLSSGSVSAYSTSRLTGFESNFLSNIIINESKIKFDLVAGYRYLQLDEGLSFIQNRQVNPALPPDQLGGAVMDKTDIFDTTSTFNGGTIGVRMEYRYKDIVVSSSSQVSLGATHHELTTSGLTVLRVLGAPAMVTPGGLLALSTNSGEFSRRQFTVIPEATTTIGYQITRYMRISAGYDFLFWSNVVRPADQIDFTLNSGQIPPSSAGRIVLGQPRPAAYFQDTNFWAHGVVVTMEFRY